jgi:chaperone BCS1
METLLHLLRDAVAHNQFIQGGFVLALFGIVGAYCRRIPAFAWGHLRRQFITRVEVSNNDPLFEWVTFWLAKHPYSRRARDLTATSADMPGTPGRNLGPQSECAAPAGKSADRAEPKIILTPAPGTHFMRYRGTFLWLERVRNEPKDNKNGGGWFRQESYTLRVVGKRREVALELLEEARQMSLAGKPDLMDIYFATYDYWARMDSRKPRPLPSVFLPAGVAESVVADVREFMGAEEWYARRGIPYRRGYLLHGIPGSGKTSFICALAGELKLDLYILSLSGALHTDSSLPQLLARVPPFSLVLIEDIDAAFDGRDKRNGDSGLSFAGFLNALDGAASRDGWVRRDDHEPQGDFRPRAHPPR